MSASTSSSLHPHSRKARQIHRANVRQERRNTQKAQKSKAHKTIAQEYLWFHARILEEVRVANQQPSSAQRKPRDRYTDDEMLALVDEFLNEKDRTFTTELEQRRGKLNTTLDLKHQALKAERIKFNESGLELPDITTRNGYRALLEWDGKFESTMGIPKKKFRNMRDLGTIWASVKQGNEPATSSSSNEVIGACGLHLDKLAM